MKFLMLPPNPIGQAKRGFTLIELLVAVGIILTLLVMTAVSVNFMMSGDRIKGSARQIQSFLAGVRDRAIYSNNVRGMRLLLDPENNQLVSSIVMIGAPDDYTEGRLFVRPLNSGDGIYQYGNSMGPEYEDSLARTVVLFEPGNPLGNSTTPLPSTFPSPWKTLADRGFLGVGSRIKIPDDESGSWYYISSAPFALHPSGAFQPALLHSAILLDRPCQVNGDFATGLTYRIELRAGVLPGENPTILQQGVVIDLNGSQIPPAWRPTTYNGSYGSTQYMDILFSKKGDVTGDAASLGNIHLLVADKNEALKWRNSSNFLPPRSNDTWNSTAYPLPAVPANDPASPTPIVTTDQVVVTIATRTGRVTTHYVDQTNTVNPSELRADDPYRYAELGELVTE